MRHSLRISSFLFTLLLMPLCSAQNYRPFFRWPQTVEDAKELKLTARDASLVINEGQTEADPASGSSFSIVDGFTFAQLETGKIYLVASVDVSGRGFFHYLQLKYCGSAVMCVDAAVDAVPPHDFKEELVDLDGDGVDEIVTKNFAGGYEGNRTEPIYKYGIYKMMDGHPVDVSARYKAYYEETLLPRMKATAAGLRAAAVGDTKELQIIDALDASAQDDYQRRIIKNARAGLDHAAKWVHSDDERLRDYGMQTLVDIDDPEAEQMLVALKGDPNSAIAKDAASALDSWREIRRQRKFQSKN